MEGANVTRAFFNNLGDGPLKVPGCGLPIDFTVAQTGDTFYPDMDGGEGFFTGRNPKGDVQQRFRHGANDFVASRLTVRELSMLAFMNAVTDKVSWHTKVFDEAIITKWRAETTEDPLMSKAAFDWCILELQDKAKEYEKCRFTKVLDIESPCIKSDTLIDETLKKELQQAVEPLLNATEKDWHPGSNDQVLNLVHPSLFPLVYGTTRILEAPTVGLDHCLKSVGTGNVLPNGSFAHAESYSSAYYGMRGHQRWSQKFQWLPAEVRFTGDEGTNVEITSYINNLHPNRHRQLYKIIERLISASIKPWDDILVRGLYGRAVPRIKITKVETSEPPSLEQRMGNWWDDQDVKQELAEYLALPDNPDYQDNGEEEPLPQDWDTNEEWDPYRAFDWKFKRMRTVRHPEPGDIYSYEKWRSGKAAGAVVSAFKFVQDPVTREWLSSSESESQPYRIQIEDEFREVGLQVIVKLAGIELTPENPQYAGGNWHLEGMMNEHIVATSIFYYDVQNTTESSIRYRQEATLRTETLEYEQFDHKPLEEVFGAQHLGSDWEKAVQELGSIKTPEGRLIAFPNTLQHRVGPFQLADPTRAGHRRFIVLWLVDPHYRILSTAHVPPQQHDWWAEEVTQKSPVPLPGELKNLIVDFQADFPMSTQTAKEFRLQLMKERTDFNKEVSSNMLSYNLCEH